jgi:hypothetical protein
MSAEPVTEPTIAAEIQELERRHEVLLGEANVLARQNQARRFEVVLSMRGRYAALITALVLATIIGFIVGARCFPGTTITHVVCR